MCSDGCQRAEGVDVIALAESFQRPEARLAANLAKLPDLLVKGLVRSPLPLDGHTECGPVGGTIECFLLGVPLTPKLASLYMPLPPLY